MSHMPCPHAQPPPLPQPTRADSRRRCPDPSLSPESQLTWGSLLGEHRLWLWTSAREHTAHGAVTALRTLCAPLAIHLRPPRPPLVFLLPPEFPTDDLASSTPSPQGTVTGHRMKMEPAGSSAHAPCRTPGRWPYLCPEQCLPSVPGGEDTGTSGSV